MHKIDRLLEGKHIKMHLFLPSKRRIFTIVSKEEYWLDLDVNFCSCKGYYYTYARKNERCHHLQALALASEEQISIIRFEDDEYSIFLHALIRDMTRYALKGKR